MTDIIWEDPPPRQRGGGRGFDYDGFVAELKKHPGKWAVVRPGGAYSGAFGDAHQRLRRCGCDALQRKQPDGTYTLYARWPET